MGWLGIESSRFEETDVHVHLPEGATPKDGPSAGLALTTANLYRHLQVFRFVQTLP